MKIWAIGAAIAAIGIPATVTAADDAGAGVWKINGKVDGKDFVITCHFDRKGDALGGECFDTSVDNQRHPLKSGSVSGDQIKWIYQSHVSLFKFDVTYTGKITGAAMRGTIAASGHSGVFTGTKS